MDISDLKKDLDYNFEFIKQTEKCCSVAKIKCYEWLSQSSSKHSISAFTGNIFEATGSSFEPVLYCSQHLMSKEHKRFCADCIFTNPFSRSKKFISCVAGKNEFCNGCEIKCTQTPCLYYIMFCFNKHCYCCEIDCGQRSSRYRRVCSKCIETKWKSNCSFICPPYKFNYIDDIDKVCYFCENKLYQTVQML